MSMIVTFITKLINSRTLRGIFVRRFAAPGACSGIEVALGVVSGLDHHDAYAVSPCMWMRR